MDDVATERRTSDPSYLRWLRGWKEEGGGWGLWLTVVKKKGEEMVKERDGREG